MNNEDLERRRIAESLHDAIEAISTIKAAENAEIEHSPKEETKLRTDVITAVVVLKTELEDERDDRDVYDAILSRWEGEDGYISNFHGLDLKSDRSEAWLRDFANDIHRAGWELGHLKTDIGSNLIPQTTFKGSRENQKNNRQVKEFGERTLQERGDGYLQMNIPQGVAKESELGIEPGEEVSVKVIIDNDESYVRIEGVADE